MKSVNATITSKNQLTLPIKLVRKYKLDINRHVTITEKNGMLVINPQPPLQERLEKLWAQFPAIKGIQTDEELKQATREAFANKKI